MGKDATTLSLDNYAASAKALVVAAQATADEAGHKEVTPLHLLSVALEREAGVGAVFRKAGVNLVQLTSLTETAMATLPPGDQASYLSKALLELLGRAERDAGRAIDAQVSVEHLLNALSSEIRGPASDIMSAVGVGPGSRRSHVSALRMATAGPDDSPATSGSRDLVRAARDGELFPVIGRDGEVRRLLTILERQTKNSALLVGEAGVGRRTIIEAVAQRLANDDVTTSLAGSRLIELDLGAIGAGARLRSDLENRLRQAMAKLAKRGDSILVVLGVEELFGGTGPGLGEVLKGGISRGGLRMIGTTTPQGLAKIREKDPALLREVTTLEIEEPEEEGALEILRGVAARFEDHHQVVVTEGGVTAAVRLAKRYLQDRFLPDSAIDLLDEAAATVRVESDGVGAEADRAFRRLESLDAQLGALEGAADSGSVAARASLATEADGLRPQVKKWREELDSRRGAVAAVRSLRLELTEAEAEYAKAKKDRNWARTGELEHVTISDITSRLSRAEAAASASAGDEERTVGEAEIARVLESWTGIPTSKMLEEETTKLLEMESRLGERVIGQPEAVAAIARAVRRGRVGLRNANKPIGSFLFLGPSGVGKTELAKALAQFLFDDEAALTRLDMSEFMERHMAQRLVGAPPGYADSDQGGFLTEAVRKRPYSVLLFDEVEKAHEDVFDLLLQVLDDGRLTDGRGRLANFSNTVVIMTSNIGSSKILDASASAFSSEDGLDALNAVLGGELGKFFRPEFLNRISETVMFRPLGPTQRTQIAAIQTRDIASMLATRGLGLEINDEAIALLVERGHEPHLGARPLQRAFLRYVQDPLADALLRGKYESGETVAVSVADGELHFAKGES